MKMHHELTGLLRDAKLNPEDDGPRLILADWLDDHGEPERAEFVRLQCLGTTPEQKRRSKELAHTHELRWLGPVHGATHTRAWKRGLLEASATPEQILHPSFASEGQEAFEWIERLRINNFVHGDLEALVAAPHLHCLNALTLELTRWDNKHCEHGAILEDQSWAALGRLPTLPSLGELTLCGIPLDAAELGSLFAGLHQLRALDLGDLSLWNASEAEVAWLPKLPNLRSLTLGRDWGETFHRWGDWPSLATVERLTLPAIEPWDLVRLLESPFWRALRHLEVSAPTFSQSDLETLLALPPMANLRTLKLSSVEAGDAPGLIECPALNRLERLELNCAWGGGAEIGTALRNHFRLRIIHKDRP